MTTYRNARDLQNEIEQLLGHDVDAVTMNHRTGEVNVEGVTDQELDEIRQNVDPQASSPGTFRRGRSDDPGGGQGSG